MTMRYHVVFHAGVLPRCTVDSVQNDAIPLFFNIRNLNVSHHIQEIQWSFFTQPVFFLSLADEIKLLVLAELCILSERRIILF